MTPDEFLRIALDPVRLAVLGHAATQPIDTVALAEQLGVPAKKVLGAVAKLREAGLVTEDLKLDRAALQDIGAALPDFEQAAPEITAGDWSTEEVVVLDRFFEGSRLKEIPASRSKRIIVLERLAQEFEPGVRYGERQVNLILQMIHPDYAALRRYLVDDGFLTRADGVYWRTGGRFET